MVVSELEAIGVKIDDEDKALRLIWSLPSSYGHIKPVLMYGKETLSFEEVASKIISEERRMKSEGGTSSHSVLVATSGPYGKKNHGKSMACWKCGRPGHVKKNCPGGAISEKGSESDASNVSLVMGEDDIF